MQLPSIISPKLALKSNKHSLNHGLKCFIAFFKPFPRRRRRSWTIHLQKLERNVRQNNQRNFTCSPDNQQEQTQVKYKIHFCTVTWLLDWGLCAFGSDTGASGARIHALSALVVSTPRPIV